MELELKQQASWCCFALLGNGNGGKPEIQGNKGKDDIIPGKSFGNRVEHMIHPIPRKNNATLKAYPHEQESLFL